MRTGTAVVGAAAFSGVGASLAAILLSSGDGTSALRVGTTFLGGFGHNGLLRN